MNESRARLYLVPSSIVESADPRGLVFVEFVLESFSSSTVVPANAEISWCQASVWPPDVIIRPDLLLDSDAAADIGESSVLLFLSFGARELVVVELRVEDRREDTRRREVVTRRAVLTEGLVLFVNWTLRGAGVCREGTR